MKPILIEHGRSADLDTWTRSTQQTMTPPRLIVVNTSGTYWFYSDPATYRIQYMYKGLEYDAAGLFKLTDSSGNALTAGVGYVIF